MASQVVYGNEPLEVFEFNWYVKGYHACLSRFVESSAGRCAAYISSRSPLTMKIVAVKLEGRMVGHPPFNIAPTV